MQKLVSFSFALNQAHNENVDIQLTLKQETKLLGVYAIPIWYSSRRKYTECANASRANRVHNLGCEETTYDDEQE